MFHGRLKRGVGAARDGPFNRSIGAVLIAKLQRAIDVAQKPKRVSLGTVQKLNPIVFSEDHRS